MIIIFLQIPFNLFILGMGNFKLLEGQLFEN